MRTLRASVVTILVFTFHLASSQEVFRLDFESVFLPGGWEYSDKAEWGHVIGEDGGSYFRFHPYSWKDALRSPELMLEEGQYVLYYSWNEASAANPDYCDISISRGSMAWEAIDRIGGGNGRTWQKDSTVIGYLDAGEYRFGFDYMSTVRFPSQYLNLDNIFLVRREVATGIEDESGPLTMGIHPNPSNGNFHYEIYGTMNLPLELRLFDQLGRNVRQLDMIWENSRGVIRVSDLPAGIYSLVLTNGTKSFTRRIVIQR